MVKQEMQSFYNELKRRNVLRVAIAYLAGAWLLIQILETLFPIFGLAEASIRMVVIVVAILFIPTVILAWLFEVTPEGVQWDQEAKRTARSPEGRKNLDTVIIITLVVALGYFAFDKFIIDPAKDKQQVEAAKEQGRTEALIGSYGDHSIAVLPFVNMSSDPEQEYFSDGIAEELLNLLAKIKELRVISRSSAFAFKGQEIEIPAIAEKLNVAHVLEGSVRKAGNRIRITAQLIDARTDSHLWSETYDRELDNIFAIQDEISAHVVEQLKITILGSLPHAKEIDPEAYSKYLRGREIVHTGQWDKLPLAEQLVNEALRAEPDYVPAINALGVIYNSYDGEHWPTRDHVEHLHRGLAGRVRAADPGGIDDLTWQGSIAFWYDHDRATAAHFYERALAIDPNDIDLLRNIIPFLRDIGYVDEAITTAEYVLLRDPACVYCAQILSTTYRSFGEYDKAIQLLQDAIEWSPDRHLIYWALGSVLLQAGRPAEALAAFEKEKQRGQGSFGRMFALHDLGRMEEFEQAFDEYRKNEPDNFEGKARIYAWTGENDLAMENLEKLVEKEGPEMLRLTIGAGFYDKLYEDPRYDEILRKQGLHPDQQEKIAFNFTPPE